MVGWAGMGGILYKILVPSLLQCFLNWLRILHFLLIDWFIQPCVVSHGGIEFWEIREAILDFFSIPFYYKLKRSGPSISLYAHGIISMRTSQKSSFPPQKKKTYHFGRTRVEEQCSNSTYLSLRSNHQIEFNSNM